MSTPADRSREHAELADRTREAAALDVAAEPAKPPAAEPETDEYRVEWSINMDGSGHRDAAKGALDAISAADTDTLTFYVRGPDGRRRVVDLNGDEAGDYWDDEAPSD